MMYLLYEALQLALIAGGFWYSSRLVKKSGYTGPTKHDVKQYVELLTANDRAKVAEEVTQSINDKVSPMLTRLVKRIKALEEANNE